MVLVPWDPIPGGPLHPPSASSVFTAEEIRRAEDFASLARVWSWCSLAVSLLLACVLGFTRLGSALVDRLRGPWWLRVVVTVLALALAGRLVTLPFAILLRRRVLDYGLSHQAWGAFAVDLTKGLAVNVVGTSIALVVLVGVARRWPRAWPAVAGLLLAGLVMLGSFVYPLLVEPLFNTFTPLPDGRAAHPDLRARRPGGRADRRRAGRGRVPAYDDAQRLRLGLRLVPAGRRLRQPGRRIIGVDDREALSVVAHELGHARHDDVLTGSLLGAAGALLGVGLLGLLVGRSGRPAPGAPDPGPDRAGAPLLASPVENGISRRIETRADVDALEATNDPAAFIEVQKELARRSLGDPTPPAWSQFWFGSHPTTLQRIALAERFES